MATWPAADSSVFLEESAALGNQPSLPPTHTPNHTNYLMEGECEWLASLLGCEAWCAVSILCFPDSALKRTC